MPRLCVAVLVTNANGEVLLGRRNKDPRRGMWVLPGGGLEPGETWEQAARREVREETGLDIELVDQDRPRLAEAGTIRSASVLVVEHVNGSREGSTTRPAIVLFVRARADGTPVGGTDLLEPGWFREPGHDPPTHELSPVTREALVRVHFLVTGHR
jgi:ADP-ribose pyrophosphatase YjhB (NUDIX family)